MDTCPSAPQLGKASTGFTPAELLAEAKARIARRKLDRWRPYGHPDTLTNTGRLWIKRHADGLWHPWTDKPWQLDFCQSLCRINVLTAGNQLGKSDTGAAKLACHATGRYPSWWEGHKIEGDCLLWGTTVSAEFSRDVMQTRLFGATEWEHPEFGTGFIPKDLLLGKPTYRKTSVNSVIDTVFVQRANGGVATLSFKSFEMGARKHEGRPVHYWWLDEPPDQTSKSERGIFAALLARLTAVNGHGDITMTPTFGADEMLRQLQGQPDVGAFTATFNDVPHLSEARRQEIWNSYPPHERETRCLGSAMMGTGRVFCVSESDIICAPFDIPKHFSRICGIDFGSSHPTAAAWLAWDKDRDVVYVYDVHRSRVGSEHSLEQTVLYNSEAIKRRGEWIPAAWPHDGNRSRPDGSTWAKDYRDRGVRMLHNSARYVDSKGGPQPREPIVAEILERMQTGRWKVFGTCWQWLEEFRTYHRGDDGLIVDRLDDALKASFYAYMMRRFAMTEPKETAASRWGYAIARPMM